MRYVLLSALLLTTTNCASVPGPAPAQEPSVTRFTLPSGAERVEVREAHSVLVTETPR